MYILIFHISDVIAHNSSNNFTDSSSDMASSSVNELFDIELDDATDFSDCFDPDVAFPVSTFVNFANVENSSHKTNSPCLPIEVFRKSFQQGN